MTTDLLPDTPTTCPPDELYYCFVDPCMFASCPAFPEARCNADYCGGCFARFYDADGTEVTDTCGEWYEDFQ